MFKIREDKVRYFYHKNRRNFKSGYKHDESTKVEVSTHFHANLCICIGFRFLSQEQTAKKLVPEFHINEMMIGSSSLLDDEFFQGNNENQDVY